MLEAPTNTATEGALRILAAMTPDLYAVLDLARSPEVLALLLGSPIRCQSLYEGPEAGGLAPAGPMLVQFRDAGPTLTRVVTGGWGRSWGVWLVARGSFEVVRKQLRRLLQAELPDGRVILLRFYDPRVLGTLLPIATPDQVDTLFAADVDSYLIEACDGGEMQRYQVVRGGAGRSRPTITLSTAVLAP